MKTVQYFQHDYDARHDEKITKLRRALGGEGIGIYWCIVECLYNGGGKLPLGDIEDIAYDMRFDVRTTEKVVKDFGLFQFDKTHFWSNTVISRLKERKDISAKRREAALSMHRKKEGFDANAKQMQSKSNAQDDANASDLHMQNPCNIKYKNINIKDKNEKDIIIEESEDSLSVATDSANVNYIEFIAFYNQSVEGRNMPQCVKLTEKRKAAIRARLNEFGKEKVFEAITKCAQSNFCNGQNNRNWRADFDFVFNANKMTCILEGKYDNEVMSYGNNGNSNEQNARSVGEKVLGDIFAEIEGRERTERATD